MGGDVRAARPPGHRGGRVAGIDALALADQDRWARGDDDPEDRLLGWSDEACTLSHLRALRAFLGTDAQAALVLEDDVELAPDAPGLSAGTGWWPPPPHGLVKIEATHELPRLLGRLVGRTPSGRALRELCRWNGGAGAYLVDRDAARLVLEAGADLPMPIDHLLFNRVDSLVSRRLRPVQVVPAMARQRLDRRGSDTEPTRVH